MHSLSDVMYDLGHDSTASVPRNQTGTDLAAVGIPIQPHRRRASRPDFRHVSHFQPAWLEN